MDLTFSDFLRLKREFLVLESECGALDYLFNNIIDILCMQEHL
jgi:hypothetical protein